MSDVIHDQSGTKPGIYCTVMLRQILVTLVFSLRLGRVRSMSQYKKAGLPARNAARYCYSHIF